MKLTLVIPGLAWPDDNLAELVRDLPLPGLAWLLGRAGVRPLADTTPDGWLGQTFGLERPAVARLTGRGDGLETAGGHWLRADPVHLRAERTALVLADSGVMRITQQEADALIEALNGHFVDDGLTFHAPAPDRWYVECRAAPEAGFTALEAVIGDNIDPHLPTGPRGMEWTRWMNEIQMLFFAAPVNAAREAAGEPAINSVWFWGEGEGAAPRRPPFDAVLADDPLARVLAVAAGLPLDDAPHGLDGIEPGPDTVLIVTDRLRGAAQYRDAWGWRERLVELEAEWFAPLAAALKAGWLAQLTLVAPGRHGFAAELGGGARWRFWRRPRGLAALRRAG